LNVTKLHFIAPIQVTNTHYETVEKACSNNDFPFR